MSNLPTGQECILGLFLAKGAQLASDHGTLALPFQPLNIRIENATVKSQLHCPVNVSISLCVLAQKCVRYCPVSMGSGILGA